jgi:hypothetical protein
VLGRLSEELAVALAIGEAIDAARWPASWFLFVKPPTEIWGLGLFVATLMCWQRVPMRISSVHRTRR